MLNRKTIMFLALLGTYAAQAVEEGTFAEPSSYAGVTRPARVRPSKEESVGTITRGETAKPTKSTMVDQLEKANKKGDAELFCATAARFGRLLKYLPKQKGALSKASINAKCSDYFLDNNQPQAYAAVNNYQGSDVQAYFNKNKSGQKTGLGIMD